MWASVQREAVQELDRAMPGPAARLRRLGRAAGTGDARAGPGALGLALSVAGAGRWPGFGCRRSWEGSAGRGVCAWCVRDRQLAALLINVSGPLGVCHDSKGPQVLIIRTWADPLRCRRRDRQLTGRSGTDVGVALDVASWAPARSFPADDHDFRPIQVVAQHEMATGVDHPTHADPGGPRVRDVGQERSEGRSAAHRREAGQRHIERRVSGRARSASRRPVAAGRAPGVARAGCPASGSAPRSAG